jgi:DNA polymerase III alpha subunit
VVAIVTQLHHKGAIRDVGKAMGMAKENPVVDALRKLRDEEAEILIKLKPLQEAIGALEKIVEKWVKKVKSSGAKEGADENGQESNDDSK